MVVLTFDELPEEAAKRLVKDEVEKTMAMIPTDGIASDGLIRHVMADLKCLDYCYIGKLYYKIDYKEI